MYVCFILYMEEATAAATTATDEEINDTTFSLMEKFSSFVSNLFRLENLFSTAAATHIIIQLCA